MRLAVMSLYPRDPARIAGGVRAVAYHLVQALKTYQDLEIHVIHCHSDMIDSATVQDGPVTIHFRGLSRRRVVPNLITGVRRLRELLREIAPDVVHAHVTTAAEAALAEGLPTVYTIHGVPHIEARSYRGSLFDWLRYALTIQYDRRAVARADAVVAISPYVLNEYRGMRESGWHRIDNPLPDSFFGIERQPVADRILFAGSITEVKDVMALLQAFEILQAERPSVELVLAGRVTSPAYAERLHTFVTDRGLVGRVHFRGLVSLEALQVEYGRAALLVLSSREENAPMAVIEAMAAGLPVVATRVGGVPDLVADGETGLLAPPADPPALARAMARLLADPERARQLGSEGRRRAEARFRASAVAAQYYELYRRVASAARHSRQPASAGWGVA